MIIDETFYAGNSAERKTSIFAHKKSALNVRLLQKSNHTGPSKLYCEKLD
jgi:hypothetical protein